LSPKDSLDPEAQTPGEMKTHLWVQRMKVELATTKSERSEALRVARELEQKWNESKRREVELQGMLKYKEQETKALSVRLQAVEGTLRAEREAIRPDREALLIMADQATEEAKLAKLEKQEYLDDMDALRRENKQLKVKLKAIETRFEKRGGSFRNLRRTLTGAGGGTAAAAKSASSPLLQQPPEDASGAPPPPSSSSSLLPLRGKTPTPKASSSPLRSFQQQQHKSSPRGRQNTKNTETSSASASASAPSPRKVNDDDDDLLERRGGRPKLQRSGGIKIDPEVIAKLRQDDKDSEASASRRSSATTEPSELRATTSAPPNGSLAGAPALKKSASDPPTSAKLSVDLFRRPFLLLVVSVCLESALLFLGNYVPRPENVLDLLNSCTLREKKKGPASNL